MNPTAPIPDPPNDSETIGDRNLEHLLEKAYHPEVPDADFVGRVQAALQVEASARAQKGERHLLPLRRILAWTAAAAAVLVGIGLMMDANRPNHPIGTQVANLELELHSAGLAKHAAGWPDKELTARPLAPVKAPVLVQNGETISTSPGERRRVALADGSILFLNKNTTLKVEGERRVTLTAGEVFLEVAPRSQDAADGQATFTVQTPQKTVSALGTKFAVRVEKEGTGVVVTQGKVQVSGLDGLLTAGLQLSPGNGAASAAPRASSVLDWMRDLVAAAESPLVPASKYGGGALVAVDPWGQEAKLSLRKFHIDVHIEDGFARTTIDQTYFNHERWQLEGTFYFPLPPDASLNRLAMYVDGKLMEGGMVERDRARDIFETIRYANRDPALLEWVDGSTFKMRVFPLEGRQEKRIILSYVQKLPSLFGKMQYRFPTGHSLDTVRDWSFQALVKNGAKMTWNSSHGLSARHEDGALILTASAKQVKLDRDVTLEINSSPLAPLGRGAGGEGGVSFASSVQDGARYLSVRYRPEMQVQPQRQRRDWVFLFESSADRDPLLARAQIEIIRTLLNNAEHDDTFAIVTAGTHVAQYSEKPQPVTPENVSAAIAFLERTQLIGALDLGQGLAQVESCLRFAPAPHIVHVGAAIPVLGETTQTALLQHLPATAKYIGIAVGKRWNRNFMKTAAERTGGYFTQINPDESVAWRAFDLLATLNTPRLLNVHVVDDAEKVSFLTDAAALAQGEELLAVARFDAETPLPASITIAGTLAGEPYRQTLPVRDVAERVDYLPRTWAKLEIDRLLAENAEANQAKIIALSKAMYVMTPFTSLLVLENEEMYVRFKVDRGRKDHWAMYKCPERIQVVKEGEAERSAEKPPAMEGNPHSDTVLTTIMVHLPPTLLSWSDEPMHEDELSSLTAAQIWQGANGYSVDSAYHENLHGRFRQHLWPELDLLSPIDSIRYYDPVYALVIRAPSSANTRIGSSVKKGGTSIQIDTASSVAGFIQPGHRVDIEATVMKPGADGAKPYSQIVLQDIEVLATNEVQSPWPNVPSKPADSVNLRLTPQQSQLLARYQGPNATLRLLLRPAKESNLYAVSGRFPRQSVVDLFHSEVAGFSESISEGRLPNPNDFTMRIIDDPNQGIRTERFARGMNHFTDGILVPKDSLGDNNKPFNRSHRAQDVGDLILPPRMFSLDDLNDQRFSRSKLFTDWGTLTAKRKSRWGSAPYYGSGSDRMLEAEDIIRILQEPTDKLRTGIEKDTPFKDALDFLCRIHNVRPGQSLKYRINHKAFVDAGVPDIEETPVDLPPMRGLPLGTILSELLSRIEPRAARGTFLIKGDFIEITTIQRALAEKAHRSAGDVLWMWESEQDAAIVASIEGNQAWQRMSYQRLRFTRYWHIFSDLLAYAPGMNTQATDIAAILDDEAPDPRSALGLIDPAARDLIEQACRRGWQSVTLPAPKGQPTLTVKLDGNGWYTYERLVSEGLQERVLCDGANLWHLYPELGIGAKRKLSRFHRAELTRLVPWYLPPPEDLARGADLRHAGERTVAIVPRGASPEHREWRLVFADDGRLAERRIVEIPENKVVYSETYAADGLVRSLDENGKVIAEYKYTIRPATEPRLRPDARDYVVLPLPYRTREHALKGRTVASDTHFNGWSEEDALALLAADVAERSSEVRHIIDQRFFDIGDRRLGFFTLLLACHPTWTQMPRMPMAGPRLKFDPVVEHPDSQLAKYFKQHLDTRKGQQAQMNNLGGRADSFLQRLANCQTAFARAQGKDLPIKELLAYVKTADSPLLGWAILSLLLDRDVTDADSARQIADALEKFTHTPALKYVARYEQARYLLKAENLIQAQKQFRALYTETLQEGVLPPVDRDFRLAFNGSWLGTPQRAEDQWRLLMREAAATLIAKHARSAIIPLAWQCRQLGEFAMAEELITIALGGAPEEERLAVTLAAVRYHWDANELPRAESLLQALLAKEPYSQSAPLWRLAATLADKRGMLAQTVKCLDKALSIEFESMPDVVDLQAVRQEYGNLLNRCGQLADTLAALQPEPPRELLAVVVRAADRWRLLDSEATVPCQAAARILLRLNARDLAWDYLTTPMALKPNESGPWLDLARLLVGQGDNQLADRAYALAFAAEPTNAQILWDRAEHLQQAGRTEEANTLYRQLANGEWQPRFRGVQEQAKRIIEGK